MLSATLFLVVACATAPPTPQPHTQQPETRQPATGQPGTGPTGERGSPLGSALYENFCSAEQLLNEAVAAHGGAAWVAGERALRFEYAGLESYQAHLEQPWAARETELRGAYRHAPELGALRRTETYGPGAGQMDEILLLANLGLQRSANDDPTADVRGAELEDLWRSEQRLLPQTFLQEARDHLETLRRLPSTTTHDLLSYGSASGAGLVLLLDPATHRLERVEELGHWDGKGDRVAWTEFSGYVATDGVQLPARVRRHQERATTQVNRDLRLSGFVLDEPSPPSEFALTAAEQARFPEFEPSPRLPESPLLFASHNLGRGVHVLDLPPVNGRSILVEFSDHLVVVESGGTSEVGAGVLHTAAALFPAKPVRYLAMSHHHRISASGIRPYVQQGVTLLATKNNVEYLRDLATRPYRLRPDRQQAAPAQPRVEVVNGLRVLEDATQRLELHEFHTSGHTDDYVFSHVPALGFGTVGDLLYLPAGPDRPASGRTRALVQLIDELGLEVRHVTQTWPLEAAYLQAPLERLREQVRLAEERDAD